MDHSQQINIITKFIIYFFVFILGAVCFSNFDCVGLYDGSKYNKSNYDSLFFKLKSDSVKLSELELDIINQRKITGFYVHLKDSLTNVKYKYQKTYLSSSKEVRVEIRKGICDTNSVKEALNDCDSLAKVNNTIIAKSDSLNQSLMKENINLNTQNITLKEDNSTIKAIVSGKDKDYENLEKAFKEQEKISKKQLRKQKLKTIFVGIVGILTTSAVIYLSVK